MQKVKMRYCLAASVLMPLVMWGKRESMEVAVSAQRHAKLPVYLVLVEPVVDQVSSMARQLEKDLSFSGQCAITVARTPELRTKKALQHFLKQHRGLVLFISDATAAHITWRLYDAVQGVMVQGKKYTKRGDTPRAWAHGIADMVWPVITGDAGIFSSTIAYSKEVRVPGKKSMQHIYMADYDGGNERLVIDTPTVNIAPRWNADARSPLLFYSEYTNRNVRLMVATTSGKKRVAANFDGVTMVPAFSPDGKRAVFCASRGDGSSQIYCYGKRFFKKLTQNHGNNVSPVFGQTDASVYFCSDYKTGRPQIFHIDSTTDECTRITTGGYCASPNYCVKTKKLAYSKRIDGVMQIMLYDTKTGVHEQLTNTSGNKEEASWSGCGNYLVYAVSDGRTARLAIVHVRTKQQRFITSARERCGYPAWSSHVS